MRKYIKERAIQTGQFLVSQNSTIRKAAKHFYVSKTTTHLDCTERLQKLDKSLYQEVRKILNINNDQKYIRGGMATKRKYQN